MTGHEDPRLRLRLPREGAAAAAADRASGLAARVPLVPGHEPVAVFAGDAASTAGALAEVGGANLVLNTSDALDGVTALLPALATGASIVLAAGSGASLGVSPGDLLSRQLRVAGSFFGSRQELRDLVDLAVSNHISPEVERYAPGEVNAVHDRLRANKVRYRAVTDRALG
jgi:D-arabinose 1-dehydrogenase-like Zn-dependent alcohol dehydrogenase